MIGGHFMSRTLDRSAFQSRFPSLVATPPYASASEPRGAVVAKDLDELTELLDLLENHGIRSSEVEAKDDGGFVIWWET